MSQQNQQLPSSIRNIRARLRTLTRPIVWGSLAVLAMLTLFIWEFTRNPDRFFTIEEEEDEAIEALNSTEDSSLWAEESSIAADIDSSDVLREDMKRLASPPQAAIPTIKPPNPKTGSSKQEQSDLKQKDSSLGLAENPAWDLDLNNLLPEPPQTPSTPNGMLPTPIAPQGLDATAANSAPGNPLAPNLTGAYGLNSLNLSTPDLTKLPQSPLQAAMQQQQSASGIKIPENNNSSPGTQERKATANEPGQSTANEPGQSSANSQASSPPLQQNPYRVPETTQNPYSVLENSPNPYDAIAGSQNPYGTSETTPNPYGAIAGSQNPYGTSETTPNPYNLPGSTVNPNSQPTTPSAPLLPGQITPAGVNRSINNYNQPQTNSTTPSNSYEFLLRSPSGSPSGVRSPNLRPAAPQPAPEQPLNSPQSSYPNLNPPSSPNLNPSSSPTLNQPSYQTPIQSPIQLPNQPSSQTTVQPSIQSPNAGIQNLNPGLNPNLQQNQGVQPLAPTQPFSVPRSTPGRYIGGGEINTFSNP